MRASSAASALHFTLGWFVSPWFLLAACGASPSGSSMAGFTGEPEGAAPVADPSDPSATSGGVGSPHALPSTDALPPTDSEEPSGPATPSGVDSPTGRPTQESEPEDPGMLPDGTVPDVPTEVEEPALPMMPPDEMSSPEAMPPSEPSLPANPEPEAPSTPEDPTDGPVVGPVAPPAGLFGFAAVAGHGVATTTGGGGGPEVVVRSFAELAAAVADDEPRVVIIEGTIGGAGQEMLDIGSNKTLLGAGSGATLDGFGLDINGWGSDEVDVFGTDTCGAEHEGEFVPTSNVIVQNLIFVNSPDDSINVQCYTHHVWVDHNTFHRATDGSVDVKRGSDLVTVSWNHFVETDKTMLLGHSEDNGEQDRGFLRATYHHNWFDGTETRTPRVRFGFAHVLNNRVRTPDYFLGLGIEAHIYAEGNYVEAAKTLTQIFGESTGYELTWADSNHFDEQTISRAQDSGKTRVDWLDASGTVAPPTDYDYSLDTASAVDVEVPARAGAGRL